MVKSKAIITFLLLTCSTFASTTTDKFAYRSHKTADGTLAYRLFTPANLNRQIKYPLILTLHGAGERGTDNNSHITKNRLAEVWAEDSTQKKQACFVVSPQCPSSSKWVEVAKWTDIFYKTDSLAISVPFKVVLSLLDSLKREFPIDTNRMYVAGLSMGGYGTWDLIARFPSKFAAAVPLCGGCDTTKHSAIKNMPIWTFHGSVDPTVPPGATRAMVAALKSKDGIAVVQYTALYANYFTNSTITRPNLKVAADTSQVIFCEYTDGGHDIWAKTFNEPLLAEWLFLQKKGSPVKTQFLPGFHQNIGSKNIRFLLHSQDLYFSRVSNINGGSAYSIKVFALNGSLKAQKIINSPEEFKAFMQLNRKESSGIKLVEINLTAPSQLP